jgi:hypothetical protein
MHGEGSTSWELSTKRVTSGSKFLTYHSNL